MMRGISVFLRLFVSKITDFSVVLFRPHFMLPSEEHPMKTHKNQWFLNTLSPPDIPWGATHQGGCPGAWGTDAFAVPCYGPIPRELSLQAIENKALSHSIHGKSAPLLAEILIWKSQPLTRGVPTVSFEGKAAA